MKQIFSFFLLLCTLPSAFAANPKLDAALVKTVDLNRLSNIRKLVAQGADVNARNEIGQTVLERAAQYGNYECVAELLELGADVNSTSNYGGPLTSATNDLYGSSPVAVCRLLLNKGANPNGQPGRETPLLAVLNEAVGAEAQTGSMLVQVRVSTSDHSPSGRRQAMEMEKAEAEKFRRSLIQNEKNRIAKVHETGLQIVKLLIANGADVNLSLKDGNSPLMQAAQSGSVDAMKLLIASGAHTDSASLNAALGPACTNSSASAVTFLLSLGANPNAEGVQQSPVITLAALSDATEAIERLVDAGADVNARGVDQETALNLVMLRADVPAVKFLLAHGADPNLADKDGRTPLYWARLGKNTELMTLLQAAGARE